MLRLALILTALAALFIGACDLSDSERCPEDAYGWVEYQLFMGRSGPDGDIVDDAEWDTFLADTVTPRFPTASQFSMPTGSGADRTARFKRNRQKY